MSSVFASETLSAAVETSGFAADIPHLRELVVAEYLRLASDLPEGHVWKQGKLDHVLKADSEAMALARSFGSSDAVAQHLGFLLLCHDIGRLVEAHRKIANTAPPAWNHGVDSANTLRGLKLLGNNSLWKSMLLAIAHHADPTAVKVEDFFGDQVALELCNLLRDIDKREGFSKVDKYLGEEKLGQIAVNFSRQRQKDPTFGDEKGFIEPKLIEAFVTGHLLKRPECSTYEAYMLQLLAWLHDMNTPEIRDQVIREGGPEQILSYLKRQLSSAQYEQIETAYNARYAS